MTYILSAEKPPLTNIISPLRPSIWANLLNEVEEALIQTRLNPSEQVADTCMYACVSEKGDVGGSEEGEVQWFVKHPNLPLKVGNTWLKTTIFACTCDKSCAFSGAEHSHWGLTLKWGLTIRQLHTCCVHGRAAWGVWLGAGPGCVSHEEGFFQTGSSKVNIFRLFETEYEEPSKCVGLIFSKCLELTSALSFYFIFRESMSQF